jgi:hypothetical protein
MERTRRAQKRIDNPGILVRPVVTPARVEPDPVAVTSGHEAVAIVLDFVDPCRPAESLLGRAWQAGGYEAYGQGNSRTRNEHGGP